MVFKTNSTEAMRIDHTDNYVGIGTTTPINQLDVTGTSAAIDLYNTTAGSSTDFNFQCKSVTGTTKLGKIRLDASDPFLDTNGTLLFTPSNTATSRFTIDLGTGNIGVNTNVPTFKFDINGTLHINGTTTFGTSSSTNGSIVFKNSTNANTLTINSGVTSASHSWTLPLAQGAASSFLQNNGSGVLSWTNVTPASIGAWSILGNSGLTQNTNYIGTNDSIDFIIKTNNIERARVIRQGGYFGIGTSSPTSKFQIKGVGASSGTSGFLYEDNSNNPILFGRDDGYVGIDLNNPTAPLHIQNASDEGIRLSTSGGLNRRYKQFLSDGSSLIDQQVYFQCANSHFHFSCASTEDDYSSEVKFSTSGNGIRTLFGDAGTSGAKIDIEFAQPMGENGIISNITGIHIDGNNNVAAYFNASGASGTAKNYAIIIPAGGGNVGIGTSTPTAQLQVVGDVAIDATQTTVNASTSGSVVFSEPLSGIPTKEIIIYCNATTGTASYTFPVPFTNTPGIEVMYNTGGTIVVLATVVTSLSTTAVTITGAATTGVLKLVGY